MSLFEDASLIVTPNAYKEGKIYSIKPTDGSGDMTAVRATTATLVNSGGVIEDCPYNLIKYSERFENAIWLKENVTLTANQTIAPDGTNTADLIIDNANLGIHGFRNNEEIVLQNTTYTYSIYVKDNGRRYVNLSYNTTGSSYTSGLIADLQTSTITQTFGVGILSSSITPFGDNGWYRISYSATFNSISYLYFALADSPNRLTTSGRLIYSGNGTGVYIWGAQLVTGTEPKEYFHTTDRLNVPRLDYTNGSCPSILVEPQRTNLLLRSEEFENAYWSKTSGSTPVITQNSILSPSGIINADTITPNNTLTNHWVGKTGFSLTSGVTYSYSVFAKNNGYNLVLSVGSNTIYTNCNFNLSIGTTSTPYNTAGANLCVPSIVDYGNGWYRCIITFTAWDTSNVLLFSANNTTTTPAGAFGMATVTGNSSNGFYLWGAQLEAGSNATSYIPTVASAVTRNADVISKTGISDLIGQTDGVIFLDATILPATSANLQILSLNDGTSNNRLRIITATSQILRFIFQLNGNVLQYDFTDSISYTVPTRLKIAIAYKSGDIAIYVNGSLINSSTNVLNISNSLSNFILGDGTGSLSQSTNSALLFKTRLSNDELATLTTL